ncbi:CHAT domain-containing protein [Acaryochloris sp. IP29b_bin.148]|uniref:CHAT domain-containing protein n=1 Tax=Acaryochloris sp. IP29b_bin.148 TaxID=2969218 RepID=UPI00261BD5A3|nr:CHAT domain-containing protein [Acaryochloris sp. IP29b_bin.148]
MTPSNSSDSLTWIEQAKTYLQAAKYVDALNCIHQGLTLTPRNAEAWLQCGSILQKLEFYDEAITANHNAQRLFGSPDAKLRSIPLEALLTKAKGQTASIRQATVGEPPQPSPSAAAPSPHLAADYDFWWKRAQACTQAGDYAAALAAYDTVLEFKADQAQAWYQRGLVLFNLQRRGDAIASFERAIEYQPDFYQAWNNRASLLIQLGNFKEAIQSYKQALRWTDGQLWQAWEDLGMAILHTDGVEAGLAILDQGIQTLWCDAEEYAFGCGSLHQRKGDIQVQQAQQDSSPALWRSAKLSYLRALGLLDFQTFPQQHLDLWESLLQVRFHLQEVSAIQSMLLEAAIKLQTLKQNANLTPTQLLQLEHRYVGFQRLQVDWLIQQNQLKDALLWAEQCQDQTLGRWRFGPEYENKPIQYTDCQALLNPRRAIIYWHISPVAVSTFVLKDNQDPLLLTPELTLNETARLDQSELVASPLHQRYLLQLWCSNWEKAQQSSPVSEPTALKMGSDFWERGQADQFLIQLKGILRIETLCERMLAGIQEIILIPPTGWRHLPIATLFPEHFSITLLPSLTIGLNLLKTKPPHSDYLLSVTPPPSDGSHTDLQDLESLAITRSYHQHVQLSGTQLTPKTLTAALKVSTGCLHCTGAANTTVDRSVPAAVWGFSDQHHLPLSELFQLNWELYSVICLSGGAKVKPLSNPVPELETCLLSSGVPHVLSSLWMVNHHSRILLMARFHHLLHQNCNPVYALKQAQHWLRNLTYTDVILWWETFARSLGPNPPQAETLQQISLALEATAHSKGFKSCPFKHPWYWAGFTVAGNFPGILVWNDPSLTAAR